MSTNQNRWIITRLTNTGETEANYAIILITPRDVEDVQEARKVYTQFFGPKFERGYGWIDMRGRIFAEVLMALPPELEKYSDDLQEHECLVLPDTFDNASILETLIWRSENAGFMIKDDAVFFRCVDKYGDQEPEADLSSVFLVAT